MSGPASRRVLYAILIASVGCASAHASDGRRPFEVPAIPQDKQMADLVRDLSSQDAVTRAGAAWAIAAAEGEHADVVSALEPLQSDSDRSVRYAAAWALGHLRGPTAGTGLPPGHKPPKPKRQGRPRWPMDAFVAKVQGTVLIEALVGEEGEVAYARVRQSVPALDAAALEAAWKWTFEPMRVGDTARATVIHLRFQLY